MENCFNCGGEYDPKALTGYARQKYVARCGKCIFESLDIQAVKDTARAVKSGDGILDYVSCGSRGTDGKAFEGKNGYGGRTSIKVR